MLKVLRSSSRFDFTDLRQIAKNGKHGPRAQLDYGLNIARQHAREIAGNAAAGNVGHAREPAARDDALEHGPVTAMRFQKLGGDFVADPGDVRFGLQSRNIENKLARERIAVGVQAARRKRDEQIARPDAALVRLMAALDNSNDEASKVVFAGGVHVGHLRRFASDERAASLARGAAHAIENLFDHARVDAAHGEIVEEKKWRGSLRENVVDAVIENVRADRGMNAHRRGDFQFRANAVGARDQHGIAPALGVEVIEGAKTADGRKYGAIKRSASKMADALLGFFRAGNVDSGISVTHGNCPASCRNPLPFQNVWNNRRQRISPGWARTLTYVPRRSPMCPGSQTSSGASMDM